MPLFKHDRLRYLQEMAEWHQALAIEPGEEGLYHSQRAQSYRDMLGQSGSAEEPNMYF